MTLTRKYLILLDLLKKADNNGKITEIKDQIPSKLAKLLLLFLMMLRTRYRILPHLIIIGLLTKHSIKRFFKKELVDTAGISCFVHSSDLDRKLATLAKKAELEAQQDKVVKLQALDSSYFRGKSHFDDGTKKYLVFQPVYIFKKIANSNHILAWKSKGLPDKSSKLLATSNIHLIILLLQF